MIKDCRAEVYAPATPVAVIMRLGRLVDTRVRGLKY